MESQSLEDYLEAIYHSINRRGHARTKEIADDLDVKAPSVTEMFDKLRNRGYINYRKYEGVTLTDKGQKLARDVTSTHERVAKLLELLQVSPEQADRDACRVEHNLSGESITQLNKFIDFVEGCPEGEARWLDHFNYYCEHDELPPECGRSEEKEEERLR